MEINKLSDFLKRKEGIGNHNRIYRFLISILGSTPYIGGVFGAISAAWSESEQAKLNALYESILSITDDRCTELEKTIIAINDKQWIVGFIKFNPNNFVILDSSNISSITEHADETFTINFQNEIKNRFISQYYGNKEVKLNCIIESNRQIKVSLIPPLPDIITFTFFNLD
ncbi:hypothetical protein [Leptospira paudalimensis]|uniref:Uncharacterized protein n=1 Tax=Leptospira paudalimensis TaxID=2950024 RepID=A0ABT3M550_9LEPT|nr:hypothetical protein [Leptospira paudalimensis]MCW7503516.1 hypothetical protein [Leptospira paudalimensis]